MARGLRRHAGPDPIVDGWPIGAVVDCGAEPRCPELVTTAQRGFDARDPGDPEIAGVTLHSEGAVVNDRGETILMVRSGACCWVAVFDLGDGTARAIGVGYPGISQVPITVDYGP